MATILQTGEKTFTTDNGRGTSFTLKFVPDLNRWEVWAMNAAVRAWRTPGVKFFPDLAAVEAHYKVFRGISSLVAL